MKVLALLAIAMAMAACTPQYSDDATYVIPADTYYELITTPCDAPGPADCTYELGLCLSGVYWLKLGDVITTGDYILRGDVAVDDETSDFEFNLATQMLSMNGNFDGQVWTVVPIAPDVDCTR